MYKRGRGSFYKHFDFMILDMIMLQVAFVISYVIRHGMVWLYKVEIYRQMSVVLFLIQFCVVVVQKSYKGIIRRGHTEELKQTVLYVSYIIVCALVYMFVAKTSETFSRKVFILTWFSGIVFVYFGRIVLKRIVRRRIQNREEYRSVLFCGEEEKVRRLIISSHENRYKNYRLGGVIITDRSCVGELIEGEEVIGYDDIPRAFMFNHIVDEVFIYYDKDSEQIQNIFDTCIISGITIHKVIAEHQEISEKTYVEDFSGYTVLTTSIGMASARELVAKRGLDILGGLVGVLITGILVIILGPIIYIKSPGPIFFSQVRVGKNGRRFRIYKFRSMYMDAEERKKELMAQNEMQGLMFKMENDPRIIKGIGSFIRNTSLDEFPQFWNVLKGDMSLVGTRPPTVEEYEQYSDHHKKRLATKPGITGMWQVSGRSDITDFEEIVKLDTKYITDWSLGLDIRILLKTVFVVLKHDGAR